MELTSRILAFALASVLVMAAPGVVSAQASPPKPAAAPAPPPANTPSTPSAPAAGTPAPPALEPQGYTYDPQGRRDPFVSLLRRGSNVQHVSGSRPNGLAGLETGEVTLKGTIASQGTYVGILQGSDNKTYIVKAGDKLLDGTIRVINPESMVIAQQVNDPLSLEKQREVRKVLRQTEEGK